jgi:hypothetical protein
MEPYRTVESGVFRSSSLWTAVAACPAVSRTTINDNNKQLFPLTAGSSDAELESRPT